MLDIGVFFSCMCCVIALKLGVGKLVKVKNFAYF